MKEKGGRKRETLLQKNKQDIKISAIDATIKTKEAQNAKIKRRQKGGKRRNAASRQAEQSKAKHGKAKQSTEIRVNRDRSREKNTQKQKLKLENVQRGEKPDLRP